VPSLRDQHLSTISDADTALCRAILDSTRRESFSTGRCHEFVGQRESTVSRYARRPGTGYRGEEEEKMTQTIDEPPPIQLAVDYLVERAGAARPGMD
jgi:hypothetical protein